MLRSSQMKEEFVATISKYIDVLEVVVEIYGCLSVICERKIKSNCEVVWNWWFRMRRRSVLESLFVKRLSFFFCPC
jgi:hypothetical protein